MEDTCTCPNPDCGLDNAYFNGVNYECPDCDYEWTMNGKAIGQTTFGMEIPSNDLYKALSKGKINYCSLEKGKLYECLVEYDAGFEEMHIIPLVEAKNENKQFFLMNSPGRLNVKPELVTQLLSMSFEESWNDGIANLLDESFSFGFAPISIVCASKEDGTLIDAGDDSQLSEFVLVESIATQNN